MPELRQSTAIVVKIGMVGAPTTTGIIPVTNLTIDAADEAEILKAGTSGTLAISGTLTAIANADGWYNLSLASTDVDVLGPLTIAINDDSACLPIWRDYEVVTQDYYDVKYNTTGSFKASLTSAIYDSIGAFKATGFSTFDPATQGVTLSSAIYDSIGAWKSGLSTFDPATQGVSLGGAIYASISDFKATGFSTFNPATDGVTLTSATYTSADSFKATGFSTFNPATQGVTLGSAVYTSINDFKATGFSTFNPATQGVSLTSAVYTGINDFKADVSALATTADITALNDITVADIIAGITDGTYDLQEMMRLIVAACAGKISGGSTTTITIRDLPDTKDRIVATVDENGNRTAVTLDVT